VGQASSLSGDDLDVYGSDATAIQSLMDTDATLAERLHPDLPYRAAEVAWAARMEMARTVEDVLARRTRASFLYAKAAAAMARRVEEIMTRELGREVK
jgi:glycerol-3-phosphate dehydrogenase